MVCFINGMNYNPRIVTQNGGAQIDSDSSDRTLVQDQRGHS
jgi:hypothetical protein